MHEDLFSHPAKAEQQAATTRTADADTPTEPGTEPAAMPVFSHQGK
jgi:hypothetical protein